MMTELTALWLPILASAVGVFILSSIVHMALPAWHKSDYPKLPEEAKVMAALRPFAIPPGDYMAPGCDTMEEMRTAEHMEKMKQGPVFMMTVWPSGPPAIGGSLIQWFVYCLTIGVFAAIVAGMSLAPGADAQRIFNVVAITAFMGYTFALWQFSIWYKRAWLSTIKSSIDGLIYALATAGMFAWLWPH